jgi:aryl-alcohol dehydrogenase-like predicted oxidoreductase
MLTAEEATAKVRALKAVADDLDCSLAQLAIAWCTKNPRVSSVILGASRRSQLDENLGALDVAPLLDDEAMARIKAAVR